MSDLSEAPDQPTLPSDEAIHRAREHFFTAAGSQPPSDEQFAAVVRLNAAVVELGALIFDLVPDSRNRSIALTALEDVSMRANRAVFATGRDA